MSIPYVVTYMCATILAICFIVLYVEYKLTSVRQQIMDFEEAILSYLNTSK